MALQVLYVGVAAFLVLLNAFFVLAEFAIVKVRATRMRDLASKGDRRAALVVRITGELDAYLSTCQLGITVASLGLGWVGEPAFARLVEPALGWAGIRSAALLHSVSFTIAFTFVTLAHTVLGELVPKSISIRRAEAAALWCARPLLAFHHGFFPLMWILNTSSNAVLALLRVGRASETESAHSEEELRMILGASHEKGSFTLNRLLMMENVLDFGTLKVADVMIPASKVVTLDATAPWEDNLAKVRSTHHSRYPLARPESKRYDFIVHIKDLAIEMAKGAAVDLRKIARSVQHVRAELSLEELLQHFHRNRSHLAMVEDARGAFLGLVSLEDVVEELIGTVRDEFEQTTEVRLEDLVPAGGIVLDLPPGPKEGAVRTLVQALRTSRPELDVDGVVAGILKREALASTGLGEGIAIPHGRVPGLSRPTAAIGLSPDGLDWRSLDGKPAHLIFLILTPSHDEGIHVHILGKISTLLSSDYLRERLRQAKGVGDVVDVLKASDRSLPA